MQLVVERLDDDAAAIGLSRDAIQNAVESRLRAARLYTQDGASSRYAYLYVNINVLSVAFSMSVQYKKFFIDLPSGQFGTATTWDSGSTGTHGRNAGFILSSLSERIDRFLTAYLRVNEEAC